MPNANVDIATTLLPSIKLTLRETSSDFDEEIKSYISSCAEDLHNAGVVSSYFSFGSVQECDHQILQAIRWYCLSVYGLYNADSDKYMKSYQMLKATLCTQRKYTEVQNGV